MIHSAASIVTQPVKGITPNAELRLQTYCRPMGPVHNTSGHCVCTRGERPQVHPWRHDRASGWHNVKHPAQVCPSLQCQAVMQLMQGLHTAASSFCSQTVLMDCCRVDQVPDLCKLDTMSGCRRLRSSSDLTQKGL